MNTEGLKELIESKFAPGPLLAVQGFANTYAMEDDGTEEELLGSPDDARGWLVEMELARPDLTVSREEHEELVDFRSTIKSLLDSNLSGDPPKDGAGLSRFAAAHPVRYAADEEGRMHLDLSPAPSVGAVISQLLGIVAEAQERGEWPRLKICASDECRWAFYDTSRNRGGTWCDMGVCGNKINNRAYRQRRASAGG